MAHMLHYILDTYMNVDAVENSEELVQTIEHIKITTAHI